MDDAAMVKSYDCDVVDVGSQTWMASTRNGSPPCKGGLLFTFSRLCTATRVRVLQSLAVRSPESKLQKMPGARRRLRANGMTEYALTHQQLYCGSMTLPTRAALLILKLF